MPPPSTTAEQVGALPSHQGPGHAMLDPSPSFPPEGYDPRRIMAAIGVVGDKLEEHQVSTGGQGLQAIVADLLLKADRDGTPTEELESRIRSKGRAPRPWWPRSSGDLSTRRHSGLGFGLGRRPKRAWIADRSSRAILAGRHRPDADRDAGLRLGPARTPRAAYR